MSTDTVLSLAGVTKRFDGVVAVDRLSLELREGELVTLVGPSGCGKSTVLRLIAGLLAPDEGSIRLRGEVVAGEGSWRPAEKRRVGIVFQDHALFPHLTVSENAAFGLDRRSGREHRDRVREVLDLVDMVAFSDRYPHELSGGEQQRIALARALAPEPRVVLLDEPFSDLDRNLRMRVRAHTIEVLERVGATTIFVTHDQEESIAVGDRVVVMRAGRVEQVDEPAVVYHAPANRFVATFMGDADFVPAHVEAGRLTTEAGALEAPQGLPDGADIDVMARPHEVAIHRDDEAGAHVVDAEFQGAFVLYRVQMSSGRTIRSLQPHTAVFAPGTRVRVELAHGHAPTVFSGERAVASGADTAADTTPEPVLPGL